jgi:hypothetical protein
VFELSNATGAILEAPLNLPFSLILSAGKIMTSPNSLLTLLPTCAIQVDSTGNSFIDGPVQKLGLTNAPYFLFPVGDVNQMRWLELKNATGDYVVEYKKANPRLLNDQVSGIDHVSALEYWTINASRSAAASVELSFADANMSGVTDMATLRVARLFNNEWVNAGNSGTTGSAGGRGSVLSEPISDLNEGDTTYFTLASSVDYENPLPVLLIRFSAATNQTNTEVKWEVGKEIELLYFELQESVDNLHYIPLRRTDFVHGEYKYSTVIANPDQPRYLRLRIVGLANKEWFSEVIRVRGITSADMAIQFVPTSNISGQLRFVLYSEKPRQIRFLLQDVNGRIIKIVPLNASKGYSIIEFSVPHLPHALYQFFGLSSTGRTNILRFFK